MGALTPDLSQPINAAIEDNVTSPTENLLRTPSSHSLNQSSGSSTGGFKYEEFAAKLKVKCPTCQGKGKLSQSQADTLVALIPVTDKRLQPRRTKLYLTITVIISVTAIFLVAFFLLPRSISLTIVDINPYSIYMPSDVKPTPYIDVKITFQIKNENYFQSTVESISTDISWNKFILNSTMNIGYSFSVGARSTKNYTVPSRQIFSGSDVSVRVKFICATGWHWQLFEKFETTASVSYLSRIEQVTNTYYGYTACHNTSSNRNIFTRRKPSDNLILR